MRYLKFCAAGQVKKMDEFFKAVANPDGLFSVAVAAYLLIRMEKRLEDLTKVLTEMRIMLEQHIIPAAAAADHETK